MSDDQRKSPTESAWPIISTVLDNSGSIQEDPVSAEIETTKVAEEESEEPIPFSPETISSDVLGEECNMEADNEEDKVFSISFPVLELGRLDEMISNPRWVVPVLPGGQLEVLLDSAINLCKKGLDEQSEPCQRFFREGLTTSFTKILTDDAVSSWKPEIHKCILKNSEKLVELIVAKLSQDWFPLLELLGILFNPTNKFHTFNACRPPETYALDTPLADDELFARHVDTRLCKGWLVDLINMFGSLGGFQILMDRFSTGAQLSVALVYALLKPFGLCADYLTKYTVEKYFSGLFKIVPQFLENLNDEELKKETAKSDIISSIIRCLKCLEARVAESDEHMRMLELFRLRMILRMLQVSSFNGKMNALNEINQVIQNVQSYYPHHHRLDEVEYLTGKRIAEWIAENQVLQIILRDSLHQPQYVEKIEKILRFVIKERTLTLFDLDHIWAAQVGKHDAIVKNVHDLLAKLAWDFSPEQLDHLFECFQSSWTNASKRQREKLLELIRRLAEDDKDGVMAFKVLTLFWNLARSNEVPTEIMDQALTAHVKVLDYSCSQRDNQKYQWLNTSMSQLIEDDVVWVIPAMKHMREIFSLYPEGQGTHKNATSIFRSNVIRRLQQERQLIAKVCESLYKYEDRARNYVKEKNVTDPLTLKLDGRYSHLDQIRERLHFLRFLLKEGQLLLCESQAHMIWESLAEVPAFNMDREMCFEWFSKLMGEEQDLDPAFTEAFFAAKILTFDATLLTENGIECFERFFKSVNVCKKKLILKRDEYLMDDLDMDGVDYVWKIILSGSEDMASRAIQFLRLVFTALGPGLLPKQKEVHEDFLSCCADRLKSSYDTILVLEKDKDSINRVRQEVTRICRVLRVLWEYVTECDNDYGEERAFLPLHRAARGRSIIIMIRIPNQLSRGFEDVEMHVHMLETLAGLQRQVIRYLKAEGKLNANSNFKLDLYYNGEAINVNDDRQTLYQVGLRDKMMLSGKLIPLNATNSPDSSEESSGGSPNHFQNGFDGPNIEAEECLPSVMLSMDEKRMEFLCLLVGLASRLGEERLRDVARHLLLALPACRYTQKAIQTALTQQIDKKAYSLLFNTNHASVLYRLEILYAVLFPATGWESNPTLVYIKMFFASGLASAVVEMLTKNNFMPLADMATKRSAYLVVLKLSKVVLTVTSHLLYRYESDVGRNLERLKVLADALQVIPNQTELVFRKIAGCVAHALYTFTKEGSPNAEGVRQLLKSAVSAEFPDNDTIRLIIKLACSTASGSLAYFSSDHHQANRNPSEEDVFVCEEALEVLTLSFVLNPQVLENMQNDQYWKGFVSTVLFQSMSRHIRMIAFDQLFLIAIRCTGNSNMHLFFINFLFDIIQSSAADLPYQSTEVFNLLCHLLRCASTFKIAIPKYEQLLTSQIEYLRNSKILVKENGEGNFHEELLEGYICVTRDLVGFLDCEQKFQLGCDSNGQTSLIREILEEYVFPWSKAHSILKKSGEMSVDSPVQICNSPATQNCILELVSALCTNCYPNLKLTVELLTDLFSYSNDADGILADWDYVPPVGNRPLGGFVGLKNAGATCYMNSVLQQLFMVDNIKRGVLAAATSDVDCDDSIEDLNRPDPVISRCQSDSSILESSNSGTDDRKSYNILILKQIQSIFGHLALSKLQYHVPNGLWKNFRLQGEAVNLREQQDAVEFFMNLIDSVDDGLKAIGEEQVMSKNLGGLFSDQKISKECPHRYSKEEPFSVISVDIRNHSNLLDSLEQYVKGDLLEGADAYHCERCNKKVVTVKRLCVKKLPPVLAIQLKRFEYDYERVCSVKFNDYFEFPRDLEMEPYTVSGLAKIEGEIIDDDAALLSQNVCTSYRLTGIVVHSGQASGGHYYSYISFKCSDGNCRWFKFDDGDVSECRMDDDEELKNQCFGGDYAGEVFDHMMKRMSFRRQKRWWNAYILFYTQTDVLDPASALNGKMSTLSVSSVKRLFLPPSIERSVLKNNIEFMHVRSHFSHEYFNFIRKLLGVNTRGIAQPGYILTDDIEQLALLSVQLATKFLFTIGFKTKKALRGGTNEWFEIMAIYLRVSKNVRFWFATHGLFSSPGRICEYLLECPSTEIRITFSKILLVLANSSKDDGIYVPSIPMATLSRSTDKNAHLWEYILEAVLNLLRRDVSEYGRHLVQYFNFFVNYANLGNEEKLHLINLDVPATFMLVALEDGPSPPIKYQCADLSKLYQVVSILIRSCDISHKCKTSTPEYELKPNPYIEPTVIQPLLPLPENICDIVYGRGQYFCSHIKKVLDEAYGSEDTMLLIQFLCWENSHFSQIALSEVLGHIGYSYSPELKTFLDILLNLLRIEDSWQLERIGFALKGFPEEKDGLIDIIHRNKQSHPKRTYLFMKCVTALMEPNSLHHRILTQDVDLLKKWNAAVEWLQHELDRRAPLGGSSYGYSGTGWSPPSNEATNGSFFLERSLSAKNTLDKAMELKFEPETQDEKEEDTISSEGEGEDDWESRNQNFADAEGMVASPTSRRYCAEADSRNQWSEVTGYSLPLLTTTSANLDISQPLPELSNILDSTKRPNPQTNERKIKQKGGSGGYCQPVKTSESDVFTDSELESAFEKFKKTVQKDVTEETEPTETDPGTEDKEMKDDELN